MKKLLILWSITCLASYFEAQPIVWSLDSFASDDLNTTQSVSEGYTFPSNDTNTVYHAITGYVLEDTDVDCQTIGPYLPAVNIRIQFTFVNDSSMRYWAMSDSLGLVKAMLQRGLWRVEVADTVEAIYGKSCVNETLLLVSDSLPNPEFQLSILRYKARLSGRVSIDFNGNCQFDDNMIGYSGPRLKLHKDDQYYFITPNFLGYFDVSVDTGRYEMQIDGYDPSVFNGYYCQTTEAYLPDYQSHRDLSIFWSRLTQCQVQVSVRRDVDDDCWPPNGEEKWSGMPVLLRDAATGAAVVVLTNYYGTAEQKIYGPGALQVGFIPVFGDSFICSASLPHLLNYYAAQPYQRLTDTLVAQRPRLQDSLYVCEGSLVYGQMVTTDTMITTTGFLWNGYLPIQTTHFVFVLPAPQTNIFVLDTSLVADSLQIIIFTAENGCDSTVQIHFLTSDATDLSGTKALHLSPNPTTGDVLVQLPMSDISSMVVTDIGGRTLRKFDVPTGNQQYHISLEDLPPGLYLVRVFQVNGLGWVGKIVLLAGWRG